MKNLRTKIHFAYFLFLAAPFVALAQQEVEFRVKAPNDAPRLKNPLTGVDSFADLIEKFLEILLQIAVPFAAVFLIYAGFLFLKARGNEEDIKKAKRVFLYTVVGTAVLLGAWVLASAIGSTINALR